MSGLTLEQMVNELGRLFHVAEQLRTVPLGGMGVAEETQEDRARALAEVEASIRAQFDQTEVKVDAFGTHLVRLKKREEECLSDAEALVARASRWKRNREWLESVVASVMQARSFKKLEGPRVTITFIAGSESVSVDDIAKVPDEYVKARLEVSGTRSDIARVRDVLWKEFQGQPVVLNPVYEETASKSMLKPVLKKTEVPGVSVEVGKPRIKAYVSGRASRVSQQEE